MRKCFLYGCLGIGILVSGACSMSKNSMKSQDNKAGKDVAMVGNDRDEHGCIGSAGYTWSEALQTCIRLWENGIRLKAVGPLKDKGVPAYEGATDAFIVFSLDSAKVELVTEQGRKKQLLDRRSVPKGYVWNVEDDDTPNVRRVNGKWLVERRGKVIYREE